MKFYLQRHTEADDGEELDPTRQITSLGKKQAKMMGKWLKRQTVQPEVLIESNMQRSIQTAKRVADELGIKRLRAQRGAIDPDSTPERAIREMRRVGKEGNYSTIIAVSHGPLVEKIMADLTGGKPEQFHFAHGAVAHWDEDGTLHWFVSPNVVARDEDERDVVTNDTMVEAALSLADAMLADLDIAVDEAGSYFYDTVEEKRWVLGDGGQSGNCEPCAENADLGWVDMDAGYDSPDGIVDGPPAHFHCGCELENRTRRVRVPV